MNYIHLSALRPQEPLSGETQLLDKGSEDMLRRAITASRERHVIPSDSSVLQQSPVLDEEALNAMTVVGHATPVYPVRLAD